jgi:3-oxoacyl-[acyl-carrier protein] reductase
MTRPLALVTGAGREAGIAFRVALRLAETGWDVATAHWAPYDTRMPWGRDATAAALLAEQLAERGARSLAVEADLSDPAAPAELFDTVEGALGQVAALVMLHAESVDSDLLSTTVESFDRHFAVNARAGWLLIREFARRFNVPPEAAAGRIIAFTSDHTAGNLPYGASKGALDRIVLAAAREFAGRGISANVINPGPVDTGWMTPDLVAELTAATPLGRLGIPEDSANLVAFLCSPQGGWVNGQLLKSNGGLA